MSSAREAYERGVQLYNAGANGTAQGHAAIREIVRRDKAAFPERTVTIDVTVEQGDTAAFEWSWVATHTGPLTMPDGTELPPTGKRIELKGMELVQLRDGKIVVHRMYWDNMAVAGQLGVLPEAAT